MIGYTFKTYIADGREHYIYGEKQIGVSPETKTDLPFPESLTALMYLDIWKYEPLFKQMDRALMELYCTRAQSDADQVIAALDELAPLHIYFELLRLDWRYRLERSAARNYEDALDALPHKQLSHIPSSIDTIQKQLQTLCATVLDMDDKDKDTVQQKLVRFYKAHGDDMLAAFQFRPQPISFELLGDTFAEILCPASIYDLIDYHLRECLKREVRMRTCSNCGKYFAVTGRSTAEYCSHPFDEKGRTCKEVAAMLKWNKSRSGDDVFKEYRREYKKRFARIKAGTINPTWFYQWSELARGKKAECEAGEITFEEFKDWLRQS